MPGKSLSGICGKASYFAKTMQKKILLKRTLLIIIPLGLIFVLAFLFYLSVKNSILAGSAALSVENPVIVSNQQQSQEQPKPRAGLPLRLKIPSINVNAPVEYLGLTADGAMDVPKTPNEVAWFNLGPRPGESGSAVIAGHYGWYDNQPAVFDNLYKLRPGDKIFIENDENIAIAFVVREVKIYDKDDIAADVFFSTDGGSHLNIITCTGAWNENEKTRSERLVIFTDKE